MDYKYFLSLDGVTADLSNQSLVDLTQPPVSIGNHVHISPDNMYCFISAKKSVNSSSDGDVFVYSYDTSSKSWTYMTSLHSILTAVSPATAFANHEGGSGVYSAKFGQVVTCNQDATFAYVGIPGFRTTNVSHGAVAIFQRSGSTWSFYEFITNKNTNGDQVLSHHGFGSSLAISGGTSASLFVGTNKNSYNESNVYLFELNQVDNTYTRNPNFNIKPSSTGIPANSNFGSELACNDNGTRLFVGSHNFGRTVDSKTLYTGDVHIYQYANSSWSLLQSVYSIVNANASGASIANGAKIGDKITIDSSGNHLVFSTKLTVSGKYGMIYYLQYNSSTQLFEYKQHKQSPVFNTSTSPFGESISMSKDGNYLLVSGLNKNVFLYQYDDSLYWKPNTRVNQSILSYIDASSNEYTDTSVLDNFANSVSLSSNGKFMVMGIMNYRYTLPAFSNSKITGQAFILKAKGFQTIDSFDDMEHGYNVTVSLSATSNGSGSATYSDPTASTLTNTIYTLQNNNSSVKLIGIGSTPLRVIFPEDADYLATSKMITVTGRPVDQYFDYVAAIDSQGFIGVGQTSGILMNVRNAENNELSSLTATMTISGDSIVYDPIHKEFEGVKVGVSTVTFSQSGDLYHSGILNDVTLTYDVQVGWSSAYPSDYNTGYTPSSEGLDFVDQEAIDSSPDVNSIGEKITFGMAKKEGIKDIIYNIPLPSTEKDRANELRRTTLKRTTGSPFTIEIKDISNSTVDYMAVTLRDSSTIDEQYKKMSIQNRTTINSLENLTDLFQIEKFKSAGGGDYVKETESYVTIRMYHPHDNLIVYHIDDDENVVEVNTSNFPDSSIQRDNDTNYWYVKMPFSTGVGGTSVNPSGVVCFARNTLVETDQGEVKIQCINSNYHTIDNEHILGVTRSYNTDGLIICIEKDAFGKNKPNRDMYVSHYHKIQDNDGKYRRVHELMKKYSHKMLVVPHGDRVLFNILCDKYISYKVNGCRVESLHPNDDVAKLYRNILWNPKYNASDRNLLIRIYDKKMENMQSKMKLLK